MINKPKTDFRPTEKTMMKWEWIRNESIVSSRWQQGCTAVICRLQSGSGSPTAAHFWSKVESNNTLLSFLVSPPFSSSEPQKIYAKILDGVLKYPPYLSEAAKSIISKLSRWCIDSNWTLQAHLISPHFPPAENTRGDSKKANEERGTEEMV